MGTQLKTFEFQSFVKENDIINEHINELLPILIRLENIYLYLINEGKPSWYNGKYVVKNKPSLYKLYLTAKVERIIAINMIININTLGYKEMCDIKTLLLDYTYKRIVLFASQKIEDDLPF